MYQGNGAQSTIEQSQLTSGKNENVAQLKDESIKLMEQRAKLDARKVKLQKLKQECDELANKQRAKIEKRNKAEELGKCQCKLKQAKSSIKKQVEWLNASNAKYESELGIRTLNEGFNKSYSNTKEAELEKP